MSKLLLQVCTAALALIPMVTGIVTLLGIRDPLYRPRALPESPVPDSNLRFFGGVWLGVGLGMLWLVPTIEYQGVAAWVGRSPGSGSARPPSRSWGSPCWS